MGHLPYLEPQVTNRDRISHSLSRMETPFSCGGLCSLHWWLWKPPWRTSLCPMLRKGCRHPHHSCPWARLSPTVDLTLSRVLTNPGYWLAGVFPSQHCYTDHIYDPDWVLPVLVSLQPNFVFPITLSTAYRPQLSTGTWWLLWKFLLLTTEHSVRFPKEQEKHSVLYLPDSTSFAVTFNIPEIPQSYGLAV